ncbi:hypothetical protein L861_02575 [Litchfieldella anticariensis FP35 = DSM 16096]|uniref:Uncharacterized protein n=2 Tax=Litchfieldella anticariensis TaxID=258591 RepID=S2KUG2_LITA3|nr:hypothetical protein L861_02575 [Halomonas anticariensis FP35 = DSM 16096]
MLLKAVHYAIKEFNVSISLDIYGEGELRDEILSEISQLDMEGHIFLRGFDKEIEKKIHQYDIFLFTSRWEGLPNALIEALGSGVSIVATDCPSGPKEILKDGRFGKLVGVDDFKAMAENISEIYYHHDISIRTRDMEPQSSIELREHLKQFTIPCVANRYIEVALRLIG